MRRLLPLVALVAIAGCNAAGEPSGELRWRHAGVPFSFAYPADFAKASIDQRDTRGDVAGAVGLTKVDVIAVRRLHDAVVVESRGGASHEVLGHRVTSELHAVPGFTGWTLECQYTSEHAAKVRNACARALATVRAR